MKHKRAVLIVFSSVEKVNLIKYVKIEKMPCVFCVCYFANTKTKTASFNSAQWLTYNATFKKDNGY